MPPPQNPSVTGVRRGRSLRIGFLALTDSAPLAAARRLGLFEKHGVAVDLRREFGWATIREKMVSGEIDAAAAPAPMLWAMHAGVGCAPTPVLTALVLSLNGNAVTLSRSLWDAGVRGIADLRPHAERHRARPLTLGVVFPFSYTNLLLREWLRRSGVQPGGGARIVYVPPGLMFRNLSVGTIDGYCAGEPWNSLAVRDGLGWCPAWSASLQPGHVDKVLVVTQAFAQSNADEHAALVRALAEACAWCDSPEGRAALPEILADSEFVGLPAAALAPSLSGRFECGNGSGVISPDFHVFHRGDANAPLAARAAQIQATLVEAELIDESSAAPGLAGRLFREDLFREILGG